MPNINIYLPTEMYLKIQKAENMSKTVQEALTLLWELHTVQGKKEGIKKKR